MASNVEHDVQIGPALEVLALAQGRALTLICARLVELNILDMAASAELARHCADAIDDLCEHREGVEGIRRLMTLQMRHWAREAEAGRPIVRLADND